MGCLGPPAQCWTDSVTLEILEASWSHASEIPFQKGAWPGEWLAHSPTMGSFRTSSSFWVGAMQFQISLQPTSEHSSGGRSHFFGLHGAPLWEIFEPQLPIGLVKVCPELHCDQRLLLSHHVLPPLSFQRVRATPKPVASSANPSPSRSFTGIPSNKYIALRDPPWHLLLRD